MFCPNCGIKLPDNIVTCWNCGYAREANATAPEVWETCEIALVAYHSDIGWSLYKFVATAIRQEGQYIAGEI